MAALLARGCSAGFLPALQVAGGSKYVPLKLRLSSQHRSWGSSPELSEGHRQGRVVVARASKSDVETKPLKLEIRIPVQVEFGEEVALIGSKQWLGGWTYPQKLKWTEDGWVSTIELAPDVIHRKKKNIQSAESVADYKVVIIRKDGQLDWEDGPNRKLVLPRASIHGGHFRCEIEWSKTEGEGQWVDGEGKVVTFQEGSKNGSVAGGDRKVPEEDREASAGYESGSGSEMESEFGRKWQGKAVSFMKSNEHSKERRGGWDVTGLVGVAKAVVEGDSKAGNWLRKLEMVQSILLPVPPQQRLEGLIFTSIYLQWINTGQIQCVEDGGHQRPNRVAEISRRIFMWLEHTAAHPALLAPEEVLVMRKLHPRLPAFSAEFTASVPLTRIRDIAHRNDIPQSLKQEIKHTIQNKLHRSAGPEDLVATELLLQRVTSGADGQQYSEAFVEQLKIFYSELKDFFNASSLTDLLEAVRSSLDDTATAMLKSFLVAKQAVDTLPSKEASSQLQGGRLDAIMSAMHSLTGLRAVLLYGLESGLRNDAPDSAIAMRQKWRLTEIGLESYFFVLLSQFLNEIESTTSPDSLASSLRSGSQGLPSLLLGAAVLALRQLGLSGWSQAECMCIENELQRWQEEGIKAQPGQAPDAESTRWWCLRLKASLDRMRRLCDSFTESQLGLFAEPARVLGSALRIQDNAVKTFAEAEIRSSVVFQLAKVTSLLLRVSRLVLQSEGWDVLVPGEAQGKLVQLDSLQPDSMDAYSSQDDVILLLKRADGDEEIGAGGAGVRAVILLQELPHLSHLAVRARQEGVVFVTCEDEARVSELQSRVGSRISMTAGPDGVQVGQSSSQNQSASAIPSASVMLSSPPQSFPSPVLPTIQSGYAPPILSLKEATVETSGAKASACAELMQLSQLSTGDAEFSVPRGAVITFGVMDEALTASGLAQPFHRLVDSLDSIDSEQLQGAALDHTCSQIRSLLEESPLPPTFLPTLSDALNIPASSALIARSSANVEDLQGMSAAGLYDSIAGVTLANQVEFCHVVSSVWASLFTRRAVLSRRAAGVKQGEAAMAVLVQQLLSPHISFVLHTKGVGLQKNPASSDSDDEASWMDPEQVLTAELASGLGETLASGTRGTPWRMAVRKADQRVRMLAFGNFSEEMVGAGAEATQTPQVFTSPSGGRALYVTSDEARRVEFDNTQGGGGGDGVIHRIVDYSKQPLSRSMEAQKALGRRLAAIGVMLEKRFGGPQDVEGCVVGETIYIVQTRPQP